MTTSLTARQLIVLRRSRPGLRVWETGDDLRRLLGELDTLLALGLIEHDESSGYQILPRGLACLRHLDVQDIVVRTTVARKRAGII